MMSLPYKRDAEDDCRNFFKNDANPYWQIPETIWKWSISKNRAVTQGISRKICPYFFKVFKVHEAGDFPENLSKLTVSREAVKQLFLEKSFREIPRVMPRQFA